MKQTAIRIGTAESVNLPNAFPWFPIRKSLPVKHSHEKCCGITVRKVKLSSLV